MPNTVNNGWMPTEADLINSTSGGYTYGTNPGFYF